MSFLSRLDRHARLMSRMAGRNDADLGEAVDSGALSPEGYRRAVLACTGCSDPDRCEALLAEGTEGVPDFCRNRDLIAGLAARDGDG